MLKKLIKMGVVMSILLTSVNAFAQEGRYSYRSNWSLGGAIDLTWEMGQHGMPDVWRASLNVGGDVFVMKKIDYAFDVRARLHMPTAWKALQDNDGFSMSRYTTLTGEVLYSFNNGHFGYDPERRSNFYGFFGAGVAFANFWMDKVFCGTDGSDFPNTRYADKGFGHVMPALTYGLGFSYRLSENSTILTEVDFNFNDLHYPWQDFMDWEQTHANFRIGYAYTWGLSEADQAIATQKAMVTPENYAALNTQVEELEQQVRNSRNDEQRLRDQIADLQRQLDQALRDNQNKVNSAAVDSLQNIINQIKADQLNYYAMPFSVLYGVDEWRVSDEEMDKVKAIARVMKDNSNIKLMVVGFADYTGSDNYNMKLSERRANEVKRLLVKKYGIDEDRIQVDFKGKSAPFGDAQYPINRRVSFYRVIE